METGDQVDLKEIEELVSEMLPKELIAVVQEANVTLSSLLVAGARFELATFGL